MELRLFVLNNIVVYILIIFGIISVCICSDYDSQLAIKLKQVDLEYGERLSSLEQDAARDHANKGYIPIQLAFKTAPKKKCTTEEPLPKLDPSFLPKEIIGDNENNEIIFDDNTEGNKNNVKKTYLAPPLGDMPKLYVDDE